MDTPWVCLAFVLLATAACGPSTQNNKGSANCDSPTTLENGDVNGDATLEAGCYEVQNDLPVNEGTLTLEPGVAIKFAQDVGLKVTGSGALSAAGTPSDPIRLFGTDEQRGHWKGLYFVDTNSQDNQLTRVELEHAGSSQWTGGKASRGGIYLQEDGNRLAIN